MPGESRFTKVIVAYDGSQDAARAVQLAGSIASRYGSSVTVVHVFASPVLALGAASEMPIPDYTPFEDAAKAAAQNVLSKGLQLAAEEGLNAEGELIEAPSVVEAIVKLAEKRGADLIVVGTRGMTGFKQLILGSVSSGLISHARCPVLVAR